MMRITLAFGALYPSRINMLYLYPSGAMDDAFVVQQQPDVCYTRVACAVVRQRTVTVRVSVVKEHQVTGLRLLKALDFCSALHLL